MEFSVFVTTAEAERYHVDPEGHRINLDGFHTVDSFYEECSKLFPGLTPYDYRLIKWIGVPYELQTSVAMTEKALEYANERCKEFRKVELAAEKTQVNRAFDRVLGSLQYDLHDPEFQIVKRAMVAYLSNL